jgi:hypothetical protein
MAASRYDFSIEKGSTFSLVLKYKDQNGDPIDLTDWCARLTMTTSENNIITYSTDNVDLAVYNFTINDPIGTIAWLLPATTTETFTFSLARYDLELESPDEIYPSGGKNICRILYGTIDIIERYSETNTTMDC